MHGNLGTHPPISPTSWPHPSPPCTRDRTAPPRSSRRLHFPRTGSTHPEHLKVCSSDGSFEPEGPVAPFGLVAVEVVQFHPPRVQPLLRSCRNSLSQPSHEHQELLLGQGEPRHDNSRKGEDRTRWIWGNLVLRYHETRTVSMAVRLSQTQAGVERLDTHSTCNKLTNTHTHKHSNTQTQ